MPAKLSILAITPGRRKDLAIRYADGHNRPGTGAGHTMLEYRQTRDDVLAALFRVIADRHDVALEQVRGSINKHRRTDLDLMVLFSFGVFYGLVVNGVVRRIWSRFSVREDRVLGIMATVFISLVVSLLAVVVGEMWADGQTFGSVTGI